MFSVEHTLSPFRNIAWARILVSCSKADNAVLSTTGFSTCGARIVRDEACPSANLVSIPTLPPASVQDLSLIHI